MKQFLKKNKKQIFEVSVLSIDTLGLTLLYLFTIFKPIVEFLGKHDLTNTEPIVILTMLGFALLSLLFLFWPVARAIEYVIFRIVYKFLDFDEKIGDQSN